MTSLARIDQIEGSAVLRLPQDVIERLGITPGDVVSVEATERGFLVSAVDPETARQMALGREIAIRYRETLRQLAK